MARTLILSPPRAQRTLTRLAYEIIERNRGGDVVVAGIVHRGVGLAQRLADLVGQETSHTPTTHALDVTPFRDDRDLDRPDPDPSLKVEGRDVVLVDDVLFTGRTARAAIDAVLFHGRPRSIQLAVLVDRGHREFPIQPDYTGLKLPTKHRERVVVELSGSVSVFLEE